MSFVFILIFAVLLTVFQTLLFAAYGKQRLLPKQEPLFALWHVLSNYSIEERGATALRLLLSAICTTSSFLWMARGEAPKNYGSIE